MAAHRAEIDRIANASDVPTFENTIAALDRSGRLLTRTEQLFFNLTASETSPELQAVERDIAPKLAAHENAILLDRETVRAASTQLHAKRAALSLSAEQTAPARARAPGFGAGRRAVVGGRRRRD